MIRTIIIDDEPGAIDVLTIILKKKCSHDVQVVATSNSPSLGKLLIEEHKPDLVFLDIEMPGLTGIDIVRSIKNLSFRVVFITAYDAYAVEAFRLSAVDYLLKPVETDDILRVVEKIKRDISNNENLLNSRLETLEKILLQSNPASESKIGIAMSDKIIFIPINSIIYCQADGPYTHVHTDDGKKIVASKTLGEFEQQLSGQSFFRIHHSHLINLKHVKEFQRFNGGYVIMDNNKKLEVSHRKKSDFLDAINDRLV